jgi:hypothetical protein
MPDLSMWFMNLRSLYKRVFQHSTSSFHTNTISCLLQKFYEEIHVRRLPSENIWSKTYYFLGRMFKVENRSQSPSIVLKNRSLERSCLASSEWTKNSQSNILYGPCFTLLFYKLVGCPCLYFCTPICLLFILKRVQNHSMCFRRCLYTLARYRTVLQC